VHLFSNGGIQSLFSLFHLLDKKNERLLSIDALVIDSAPTPTAKGNIAEGTNVLYTLLPEARGLLAWIKPASWYIIYGFLGVHQLVLPMITGKETLLEHNYRIFMSDSRVSKVPKCFIYSLHDQLVGAKGIQETIQKLNQDPTNIVVWREFVDSPHVQHYRKYPEEYKNTLFRFLSKL
jgi:hypothetical protein